MEQRVNFENRSGVKLNGILHSSDTGNPTAYAVFAHCFTCTKNINSAVHIARKLAERGIATLRFDFTGLGSSGGEFSDSNFSTDVSDLVDAAEFLAREYRAPQLLVGHSLGGTAVLAAAKHVPSAKAVASIGSPSDPEHILHLIEQELETIEDKGSAEVMLAGRPFRFKQEFVDDVRSHSMDIGKLGKSLMVLHAPLDDTVSIEEAAKIFTAAKHPKSFVTLDKADHLLTDSEDAKYVGGLLAAWAARYITEEADDSETAGGIRVSANTRDGFLTRVNANGHHFIADEPLSVGGTNLGPTPYDLLSSSLATCTAMTLNMYARHKKLPVNNVSVEVDHDRIHAKDCEDCEKTQGRIDRFTRSISIEGELTPEQSSRMLEIADRCPVHKTLENEIKIETVAAEPVSD